MIPSSHKLSMVKSGTRLRSIPVRFRYLFLLATVFGSSFLIISITNRTEFILINTEQPLAAYELEPEVSFTIKTEGCTIPALKAFDEMIEPFNQPPKKLKECPNSNYTLLNHNRTHIWINTDVLEYHNVLKEGNITCCYTPFYRPKSVKDIYSKSVDDRVKYDNCKKFYKYVKIAHEFVKVSCDYNEKSVYVQYFVFAIHKEANFGQNKGSSPPPSDKPYYNVIIMGLDSISRLNFQRTMPKTMTYLKKKNAVELLGYNKVGDNTFPNVAPLLLGLKVDELQITCWPNRRDHFDNCPFIWQWYKKAGFYTAMGEDTAQLGTFNMHKYGFIKSPTDYYLRTFMHEAELDVGNTKDFNSHLCMGNKYFYKVLLDYIRDLSITLASSKLFGFFWEATLSHDYLTYPMAMDDSYESFLKSLDHHNYLDKTVLILLSDHGMRWGAIRLTKQGRLEERLPFIYILPPPSFQQNYKLAYNNLKNNAKRLTTPFDIHATLLDLINLDSISNDNIKQRSKTRYSDNRSISLFLPIPGNRTCTMAEIDDHWCTCHKSKKMETRSFEGRTIAEQLVKLLNEYLKEYSQCAQLELDKVLEVSEMVVGNPRNNEVGWREFMAVVQTSPGGGVFEGTIRKQNDKWTLVGTISRLNLYGNQSHCVNDYQYKLYCYCSS